MIVRSAANMEFLAQAKKLATIMDIADHFGLPRSSTFDLLVMLSEKDYLISSSVKKPIEAVGGRWRQ